MAHKKLEVGDIVVVRAASHLGTFRAVVDEQWDGGQWMTVVFNPTGELKKYIRTKLKNQRHRWCIFEDSDRITIVEPETDEELVESTKRKLMG